MIHHYNQLQITPWQVLHLDLMIHHNNQLCSIHIPAGVITKLDMMEVSGRIWKGYVRHFSILHETWIPIDFIICGKFWKQFFTDTEGWLYILVHIKNKNNAT